MTSTYTSDGTAFGSRLGEGLAMKVGRSAPSRAVLFGSLALASVLGWGEAKADDLGFASCLMGHPATGQPPQGTVVVQIVSINPNTDLEGDDDAVPFYNNKADIYGRVTIAGTIHELPEISEDDFPHWDNHVPDAAHPHGGVFMTNVVATPDPTGLAPLPVKIGIEIFEADSLLTADDDTVDISPTEGSRLDFEFDLCSLELIGNVNFSGTHSRLVSSGGDGDDAAEIVFTISLLDGRPVTVGDAALMHMDLVQVVPSVSRLAAGKPTVLVALVANNYDVPISPELEVRVYVPGSTTIIDTFVLPLIQPGEVKKVYFYEQNPLMFPDTGVPYDITVVATLDPGKVLPEFKDAGTDDCRLDNNGGERVFWTVLPMETPSLLWAKVGLDLDLLNFTPDVHFEKIVEVGEAFIRGTYPIPGLDQSVSPIDLPVAITPGVDWLRAILPGTDSADPFLMVAELGAISAALGYDRIMGVLPSHDWFGRFEGWGSTTGLSLGSALPRAVIFLPREEESPTDVGPDMTLPAHELGHTYGLSVDSSIKSDWACSLDLPGDLGDLLCGALGGFDEYKNDLSPYNKGNPAHGYWVTQGGETPDLLPLLNQEQCDSHCFMGSTWANDVQNWSSRGRWIDASDYDALIDRLRASETQSGFDLIYLSGLIALEGSYFVDGEWSEVLRNDVFVVDVTHLPRTESTTPPDVLPSGSAGIGEVRFIGRNGEVLSAETIPANYLSIGAEDGGGFGALPVTPFGLSVAFPHGTKEIEIRVVADDGRFEPLHRLSVSEAVPEVRLGTPISNGRSVQFAWAGTDPDGDDLEYTLAISPDRGGHWWPAGNTARSEIVFDAQMLQPGTYLGMVMVDDGVHLSRSAPQMFVVRD